MNKRKIHRILAYFYMPVIFTVIGFLIVYMAAKPMIVMIQDVGSMFMTKEAPDFNKKLESAFVKTKATKDGQPLTLPLSDVKWPKIGQQYGELTCEAIGLDGPVYYGDSNAILRDGIGQYNGSFIPGYGGALLLCAHNTTFFAPLQNVKEGDIFTFTTSYGIYQYKITAAKVLDHEDPKAYDLLQEKEQLILYTCYPFERLVGIKTDRLFVYGDKISGPDLVQ